MRIALLVSSMHTGGAERVASILCDAWAARGDTVSLVATWSGGGECHYRLDPRVALFRIADRVRPSVLSRLGYPGRLLALRGLIRELQPDVVISFLTNVNVAALLALRGLPVPIIACERSDPGAEPGAGAGAAWRTLRRVAYPWAELVTVQTEGAERSLRAQVPRLGRVEIVPNPVPDELLALARAPRSAGVRRRVLAMGRLSAEKQFDHLVDAFATLAARRPDTDLWIWGEGPLRGAIERQVDRLGLNGRVFLPGRTGAPWQEMMAGDVLAMSSAYEGFPNVMLEAMALGVPCVAYDCPSGPRELSDHGRLAALVAPGDRAGLADAVEAVLADPLGSARRAGEAALRMRERYALPGIIARWDRLIGQARGNSPDSGSDSTCAAS